MFLLIRPNIYYGLGYNTITGFMYISLASLIEGHWRIFMISLLLFMIVFNPFNVDALLYGAPIYSDIYICPHLVYLIGPTHSSSYLFDFLLCTNYLSCILYV